MENWAYERRQTALQVELRKLALRGNPNNMTTLTFKTGVSPAFARKCFGVMASGLKREMFGWKSRKRFFMFPVVEGDGHHQQVHIHCLMQLPGNPKDHMEAVRRHWVAASRACGDPDVYCPDSDDWFLVIGTERDQRRLANYCVKSCAKDHYGVLWDFVPRKLTQ